VSLSANCAQQPPRHARTCPRNRAQKHNTHFLQKLFALTTPHHRSRRRYPQTMWTQMTKNPTTRATTSHPATTRPANATTATATRHDNTHHPTPAAHSHNKPKTRRRTSCPRGDGRKKSIDRPQPHGQVVAVIPTPRQPHQAITDQTNRRNNEAWINAPHIRCEVRPANTMHADYGDVGAASHASRRRFLPANCMQQPPMHVTSTTCPEHRHTLLAFSSDTTLAHVPTRCRPNKLLPSAHHCL
jgi:hypothetical protein